LSKEIWVRLGWARFASKFFSLISEIKRIWIRFTCVSLFHYKISLLFFHFFSLIFASNFSLRFTWVIFASKGNKAKRISSLFFCFFFTFFTFLRYFLHSFFRFKFWLRFDFVISLRNEAKFKSIFSLFSLFSLLFRFFWHFSLFSAFFHFFTLNFRFASIFSLNFRLFYLSFSLQIFGVSHRSESCEIRLFFASKRNEIFASISNFASVAKVRAHPRSDHEQQRHEWPICEMLGEADSIQTRAQICKPFKEPRNRFPRNRFLGSLNVYKFEPSLKLLFTLQE
jgi:hypothetical protein